MTPRCQPGNTRQQKRNGHSPSQIRQLSHSQRCHTWSFRTKRRKETGNHGVCTHPPFSRTPGKRLNNPKSKANSVMAWNDHMDHQLCQGLCNVPTEQNPDTQTEDPTIPHYYRKGNVTLPKDSNGPDYRTTKTQRKGRHPHHCRPQMLKSCDIPPMFNHNHGTRNCATIHGPYVSMVRTSYQSNQR